MARQTVTDPADFIVPLDINGMSGRMLHVPAPKNRSRQILMIYGHHSSLERWWGLVQVFNQYGAVTVPDLPGFGGMDSFYKIGKKPTIDNLADYLAAFITMRYKRKRLTIVGMSFGFVVATRMLQRYPELAKKVDMLISLVGFADTGDFIFNRRTYWTYRTLASFFSTRLTAALFRYVCLQPRVLRFVYGHTGNRKFVDLPVDQIAAMTDVEIQLWHCNDVRTWMFTIREFLHFTNCTVRVNLPVWHVGVANDHFFNNHHIEQHLRVIFTDFIGMTINATKHAPTVVADMKDAAPFVPPKLKRALLRPQ